ncbi:MAG: PAS domain-containing hybrid sensor histidine kinase/response regulator [Pyrinomonadaceae bacterium]
MKIGEEQADQNLQFQPGGETPSSDDRAGRLLRSTASLLAATLQATNDGILIVNLEHEIVARNERLNEMWCVPESLVGSPDARQLFAHTLTQLKEPEEFAARVEQLYAEPETSSHDLIKLKDGRSFERTSKPQLIEGRAVGRVWSFRDVSEQRRAEESLRRSEERYRALAETATDAIITINAAGQIAYVNEAARRVFGYEAEEMVGQRLHLLLPEYIRKAYDSALGDLDEVKRRFGPWAVTELPGLTRSGREIPLEISFSEFSKDGERFVTAIMRDISERKETEERLRQMNLQLLLSQKLEAVGTLTGGIAHEFRNILTAITMHTGFLRKKAGDNENLQRHVRGIAEAGQRARTITDQLLAFSRKEMRNPSVLDLNKEIRGVVRTVQPELPGVRVELDLQSDLSRVLMDRSQLGQLLLNLIVNAREAMPQSGTLIIQTDEIYVDEESAQRRGIVRPGYYVRVRLTDTGVGMDDETQKRIFEPFFTTKDVGQGTGLGLSMVYGIIKVSKGYVLVESTPGVGTTFEIFLPQVGASDTVAKGAREQQRSSPTAESIPFGHATVLLVEDEQALRELIAEELHEAGYRVLNARHGEEGLQIAESYLGPIDLMISDLKMPEMGGEELAERLCAARPETKVLFISGFPQESFRGGSGKLVHFLQKPFPVPLTEKLREILDQPPRRK